MTRWLFVAMVLALGASGCGRSNVAAGPSCEEVTEHVYTVTRKAYPGHGEMAMGNRKGDVQRCETTMKPAERSCLLAATDLVGLAKCRRKYVPRDKNEQPAPRPGALAPPPVPSQGT